MRKKENPSGKKETEQGIDNAIPEPHFTRMQPDGRIVTDPFGSWTGTPLYDGDDVPVQDVDDL